MSNSAAVATRLSCRFCSEPLKDSFCNLGKTPISNAFLNADQLLEEEPTYPLHAFVCSKCWLVQIGLYEPPENIFDDSYLYFSSFSTTWLQHSEQFVKEALRRFHLGEASLAVELASNDGYLLQYFLEEGVKVLGIEPSASVAKVALEKGIDTRIEFFGVESAKRLACEGMRADILVGNNVLAHVPDINDFVGGMKILLKERGVISMEFPHLLSLIQENQFDTIYHEHFSYISALAASTIFAKHGLEIFDIEKLPTHGGSLRIWAQHTKGPHERSSSVAALLDEEIAYGLNQRETYLHFSDQVEALREKLRGLIFEIKESGASIVCYGAAAKGNTLLNYCGISHKEIDYAVDRNTYKVGKWLPGSHIPVCEVDKIMETEPEYIMILPWNLKEEIIDQMAGIRGWGGKFIVPIPEPIVIDFEDR